MSKPKKSTEAEDVLDFLNSLPETNKANTKASTTSVGAKNDDDILDFLDELEQSKVSKKQVAKESAKESAKETVAMETAEKETVAMTTAEEEPVAMETTKEEPVAMETAEENSVAMATENNEDGDAELGDPISSISNWWSSSGSATVSSFWSKTTQQASTLRKAATEEASRIAMEASTLQTDETKAAVQGITLGLGSLAKNLTTAIIGSTDEILRLNLVHDLENYELLGFHVKEGFNRVLSQVQGGIRVVVDEKHLKKDYERYVRRLNLFHGKLNDGEKLAFANIDDAIKSYAPKNKQGEQYSDVFVSIIPVSAAGEGEKVENGASGSFCFNVVLKDITNDITVVQRSQSFPNRWAEWLDGSNTESESNVEPSEWVAGWIDDGLALVFGTVAQRYVVERMGY